MYKSELILHRIWLVSRFNIFQFIKYNFFKKQVHRSKGCYIIPFGNGKIYLARDTELILNGNLIFNKPLVQNANAKSSLCLFERGKLIINGEALFQAGACLDSVGVVTIDGNFLLSAGAQITCKDSISIGEGTGISTFVRLRDTTSHPSGTNPKHLTTTTEPIVIGKHVWIGERSSILQGSVIGDGAIIGYGAKVKGVVSPRGMVAPSMDKEIMTGVYWYLDETTREATFKKYYSDITAESESNEAEASKEAVKKVCDVFKSLGYDEDITHQEDLLGCKCIDSLSFMSLIVELESAFCVKIPSSELNGQKFYSIGTIASLLEQLEKNDGAKKTQTEENNGIASASERKPLELDIEDTNKPIVERIFENAIKTPDKVALITETTKTTYRELCTMIYAYSEEFKKFGVKKGDRVVLQALCDVRYIAAYYAGHLLSAIAVPVEKEVGEERILEIAGETESKLVISGKAVKYDKSVTFDILEQNRNQSIEIPNFALSFPSVDEPSQILFTTGTTGKSKGVLVNHKRFAYEAYAEAKFTKTKDNEVQLILSPLNHTWGIRNMHYILAYGQTAVLESFNNDISALAELVKKNPVTAVCIPPAILRILMMYKDEMGLGEIDYIAMAGAPLSETDLEMALTVFPKTRLWNSYGTSETGSVFWALMDECKETNVGFPALFTEVKLKLENGELTREPGKIGLISTKSPMNMVGYYHEPELTQSVRDGDYIVIKDFGYYDENGCLHFAGRADDVINIGGYKTSPLEIEAVADKSGTVQESILIKTQDKNGAEYLELLVVPKGPDFSPDDLIGFIKNKVEAYRVPKKITVVDELKKTYNGKLDRKAYRS